MARRGRSIPTAGQIERLRDELCEEGVALPLEGELGERLLEELTYARSPRVHESRVPAYGCVILPNGRTADTHLRVDVVPAGDLDMNHLRRFADGSRVFLVTDLERPLGLACLDRHSGEERTLIGFVRRTGALVVQRADDGHVSVITQGGVIVWDGMRWLQKPHADRAVDFLQASIDGGEIEVLHGLLELCLHWLMPARTGTTFVWHPSAMSADLEGLEHVEELTGVPLTVIEPLHHPALASAIGQSDGAVLLAPDGKVLAYGATLLPTGGAVAEIAPRLGTRHTSAHRFSHDHPEALVVVVSEDGPLSLYQAGSRIDLSID